MTNRARPSGLTEPIVSVGLHIAFASSDPSYHCMPSSRSLVATLCLAAALAGRSADAQILPGAKENEGIGEFTSRVRQAIDSTLRKWEQAVAARDAGAAARLYLPAGGMYPSYGAPILGRQALTDAFAHALPRMSDAHFVAERVTVSGELAAVAGELTYQVPFPGGGSYERQERVQLAMRMRWNEGWLIEMQSGGDLAPTIAWVRPPRAMLRPGETDTVTVRVTDALGGGIPDVLVAFGGEDVGAFSPAGVRTDARGEATAYRTAGAEPSVGELRVTTAIEPRAPLLALVRTVVAGAGDAAARTAGPGIPQR